MSMTAKTMTAKTLMNLFLDVVRKDHSLCDGLDKDWPEQPLGLSIQQNAPALLGSASDRLVEPKQGWLRPPCGTKKRKGGL